MNNSQGIVRALLFATLTVAAAFLYVHSSRLVQSSEAMQGSAPYTLHEWGTFTSVSGSDGVILPGLEREEEVLPPFVYAHDGMNYDPPELASLKGMLRPVENVTVKMETPVIYAYAEEAMEAAIDVRFEGGTISQWYPQRSDGETVPVMEYNQSGQLVEGGLDFAGGGYDGHVRWDVEILPPGEMPAWTHFRGQESLTWEYPRQTDANMLRAKGGEHEKYLFYRGLGNFEMPVRFVADAQRQLHIENLGDEPIPFLLIFDHDAGPDLAGRWTHSVMDSLTIRPFGSQEVRYGFVEDLAPGETRTVDLLGLERSSDWMPEVFGGLQAALEAQGLYRKEAEAMIKTWWQSYFATTGLRVFWIVPRGFTDRVLPLTAEPAPRELVRVLVGRSEILTPDFEAKLLEDFDKAGDVPVSVMAEGAMAAASEGALAGEITLSEENLWSADRFGLAYAHRVRALR